MYTRVYHRWFLYGSFFATMISFIPLLKDIIVELEPNDDTLPALSFYETWIMLVISGFFYTLGSYAFVRAFREPQVSPMCSCKLFSTDELVGAWLFLAGTLPGVPFALMYWSADPSNVIYFALCVAAVVFVILSILFVIACYPSTAIRERKQYVRHIVRRCCGPSHWSVKHLQSDWLATTWFFFWATLFCLIGSIALLWDSIEAKNTLEVVIYGSR